MNERSMKSRMTKKKIPTTINEKKKKNTNK